MYAISDNQNIKVNQVSSRTQPVHTGRNLIDFLFGDCQMPAKRITVKVGQKFNRWTILSECEKKGDKRCFACKCDCGTISKVRLGTLRKGDSKSCGCLQREFAVELGRSALKHGQSRTRTYQTWSDIKQRCLNPKNTNYLNYGGRGISMCSEWLAFPVFTEWALSNGYKNDLTIERIDNNGDYAPLNCTWIKKSRQIRNQRRNHRITYKGRTRILVDWAKEKGLKKATLTSRIRHGWSVEKALTLPTQIKFRNRRKVDVG